MFHMLSQTSQQSDIVTCQPLHNGGVVFVVVVALVMFRGRGEQQSGQVWATIDQSDIRGSELHNHDLSGAASD
jgi:hypothetical protein